MSQLALPLDWQRRGEGEGLLLCDANADALALLRDWPQWPGPAAILVGPRRSGRTTIGRLFARESGGIMIDDAESTDEEALFHHWNNALETGVPRLLIATRPPGQWAITLPDLRTRLATAAIARIAPPDEALAAALLAHDLARLGAAYAPDVPPFVARRCERRYFAISRIAERLNAISVSQNCKISVAIATEVLAAEAGPEDD